MIKSELILYKKKNVKNRNLLLFGGWLLKSNKTNSNNIVSANFKNTSYIEAENDISYKIAIKLTNLLSISLNKILRIKKKNIYWKTILYPWALFYCNHFVCLIRRAEAILKLNKKFNCKIENYSFYKKKIPNELIDFALFAASENWNASQIRDIFLLLQKKNKKINFQLINNPNKEIFKKFSARKYNTFKDRVLSFFLYLTSFLPVRKKQPFIIGSFLPWFHDIFLKIFFFSFPKNFKSPKINYKKPNLTLRDKLIDDLISKRNLSKYEKIIFYNIKHLLPVAYLESHNSIREKTKKINWPSNPKFIFTSQNHGWDEFFKIWCAEKRSQGTPFFIGQHGSGYNTLKSSKRSIEEIVADNFITWGWKNRNSFHVPGFMFKI